MEDIILNAASFIFLFLLFIVYSLKKRIHEHEDNMYNQILIYTVITCIFGIASSFFCYQDNYNIILINISSKLYLIGLYWIIFSFMRYSYIISKQKIDFYYYNLTSMILSAIILFLPLDVTMMENKIEISGICGLIAYLLYGIMYFIIFINIVKMKKKDKKIIPMFLILCVGLATLLIQYKFENINNIINILFTAVVFLMYFTIENPDMKLVEYERKERDKALATAESKTEFLSSMSHELRTPLNAIIGLSEDIKTFNVNNELVDDTSDLVKASNTLLDVIGSILDASKIESGKLDVVECNYDSSVEFNDVVYAYKKKAMEKNLELNFYISENVPKILYGDKLRIKQIMSNLLSNAVKFTDAGKINVNIEWMADTNNLYIRIADTGKGMKQEEIDQIFAKDDIQIDKVYSVMGTGLGLTITRNLVKILGGKINVDSMVLAGTKYDIVIPQKLGDEEEFRKQNQVIELDINSLDFTGKKILVVDDNALNIKVLKKAIKTFNFEIDECYNGKDAINKIEMNNDYDLILMDIMMPVMGGEEAIGILRTKPNFKTPVIALTADAVTGANEKYRKMGFDDYMSKPFSRDIIAKKISTIFEE